MTFRCATCGELHEGLPDQAFDAPLHYAQIPEDERAARATLQSDFCTIDRRDFFVRGCLPIRIKGTDDTFTWGVWVTLSEANFKRYWDLFEVDPPPPGEGPYFGWLSNRLAGYPDTLNLKTHVHLRAGRQRPLIVLEPTDHPLAVHQRDGITMEELLTIIGDPWHDHPV